MRKLMSANALFFVLLVVSHTMAQDAPIQYSLTFREADHHVVQVEANIPTDGQATTDLTMPVWTPGSYLVREYARQVEDMRAFDARTATELKIQKTSKNNWRVENAGASEIQIRYRLYCREMGVRTNWVESSWAFLTGAATFVTRADALQRVHLLRIESLPQWPEIATSLATVDAKDQWHRQAKNFDDLIDSPILLGNLDDQKFEVGGKQHHLVTLGADHLWDTKKAVQDVKTIIATEQEFWGETPYEDYWFLNIISESGGGLEHDNSCVLMSSRWAMRKRDNYVGWLALVSHEFFHAWNVRRLRPKELMQYNYGTEQYFGELWIAEGLTSYFDDLFVARSRLCSRDEYLGLLSKNLAAVQTHPGRLMQSLYDSSWDTWIKFYRPDENANNSRVNYYSKGALVGLLLDVEIQRMTAGQKDLRDVMRRLWTEHRATGYTNEDFKRIAGEEAGGDLTEWFQAKLDRADELDFTPFLDWYGLRFKSDNGNAKPPTPAQSTNAVTSTANSAATDAAKTNGDTEKPKKEVWIGWETAAQDGRLLVKRVPRGSPADLAGINADDEVIALDGYRLTADVLNERLGYYQPGEQFPILIARRGKLVELRIELGTKPTPTWQLEVLPDATAEQKARLAKWLNLPPEPTVATESKASAEPPQASVGGSDAKS